MPKNLDIFLDKSAIAFDLKHRKKLNFNISRYNEAVKTGKTRYASTELARERASYLKDLVVSNLGEYLQQFEKNAVARGTEIIWARNSKEAIDEILKILSEHQTRLLVKSKSMISEETELNENLEKVGIESVETDLGEFIVQVAGEKPYHILTPAMHKSKEDVAELFHKEFATPKDSTPEELTNYVRKMLRGKFLAADAGVTGANFLVADTGSVVLTENEGNGMMSTAFPGLHIVISGIEKILPSMNDLHLMLPLLASVGTGQQLTVYNSVFTGLGRKEENNDPVKMVVVLLDNNRSKLAGRKKEHKALKCIRCGACLNACPVYKNIGGYTYNTTYSGPIGSVITPYLQNFKDYGHLSYACTVCGACSQVCPVKIPLHELLLLNRKVHVERGEAGRGWNTGMKAYAWAFSKRSRVEGLNGSSKNRIMKLNREVLGEKKDFPQFSNQSFNSKWKSNLK